MSTKKLIIATSNIGKLAEFRVLLDPAFGQTGPELVMISSAPSLMADETGATFEENAAIKAVAGARLSRLPCLADDSGLCVDALGGEPGIASARWLGPDASDEERNQALLLRLKDVPLSMRTAKFVCALCIAFPDGSQAVGLGECLGRIAMEESGSGGFGYDPIFVLEATQRTMAELSASEKNEISHRAVALRDLLVRLSPLQTAYLT